MKIGRNGKPTKQLKTWEEGRDLIFSRKIYNKTYVFYFDVIKVRLERKGDILAGAWRIERQEDGLRWYSSICQKAYHARKGQPEILPLNHDCYTPDSIKNKMIYFINKYYPETFETEEECE